MKKYFVITSKNYKDDSIKIGSIVELDTKDVDKIKQTYEVKEINIENVKSKTKKK